MKDKRKVPPIQPLYGVAMQEAMATGDLEKMKEVAEQAEYALANIDEIQSALSVLTDAIKNSKE